MSFLFKGGERKAKDAVRNWEKSQVARIAKDIVRIIPDKVPFLRDVAESSLSNIINKNMEFSMNEPQKVSKELYHVVDTVRVRVGPDIPLIGRRFTLSIDYNISVNVKEKRVVEAKADIGSLKIDFA